MFYYCNDAKSYRIPSTWSMNLAPCQFYNQFHPPKIPLSSIYFLLQAAAWRTSGNSGATRGAIVLTVGDNVKI